MLAQSASHHRGQASTISVTDWLVAQLGFTSRAEHRREHERHRPRPFQLDIALASIERTRSKYFANAAPVDAIELPVVPLVKRPCGRSGADARRRAGLAGGKHRPQSRTRRFAARARHFIRFHLRHNLAPLLRLFAAGAGAVLLVKLLTRAALRRREGRIRLPVDEVEEQEETREKPAVTSEVVVVMETP